MKSLKYIIRFVISYMIICTVVEFFFGSSQLRNFLIFVGMLFAAFIQLIRKQWRDRYLIQLYRIQDKIIEVETARELFELRRQLQDLGYRGIDYLSREALDKALNQIDNRIKNEFNISWTTLK